MTATIVLAEDHPLVLQSLKKLLQQEVDFQVVGEPDDGVEAVRITQTLRPDVLVTDLSMPGLHGFEVIRRITGACPETRIIVVSIHDEEPYIAESLRLGAWSYVRKQDALIHLVPAIRAALSGKRYACPP